MTVLELIDKLKHQYENYGDILVYSVTDVVTAEVPHGSKRVAFILTDKPRGED